MTYEITWESPTSIWVRFVGTVTFADTVNATNEVHEDSRADGIKQAIWDFSDIDSFTITESEVEEIAATDCAAGCYMKHMKAAFVIADPELMRLGERYISEMREFGSTWQNRLFPSLNDARAWVGAAR